MFSSIFGRALAVPALFSVLAVAGCQTGGKVSSAEAAPVKAVVATGHGMTTTFYLSTSGEMMEVTSSGGKVCPECKAAAKSYFAGGKLVDTCTSCGSKMMATTYTPTSTRKG